MKRHTWEISENQDLHEVDTLLLLDVDNDDLKVLWRRMLGAHLTSKSYNSQFRSTTAIVHMSQTNWKKWITCLIRYLQRSHHLGLSSRVDPR